MGARPDRRIAAAVVFAVAGACAGPVERAPSAAIATAVPSPSASPRPALETPRTPTTLSPAEICERLLPLAELSYLGECDALPIRVGVWASAEGMARALYATYGGALELSVGHFPFPPPEVPTRACDFGDGLVVDHEPLRALPIVDGPIVRGELSFGGTVRITNTGATPFDLATSDSYTLALFLPGERWVAATSGGWFGVGFGETLSPGESVELPGGGATASCDSSLGYVVPAGRYEVRASVDYQPDLNKPAVYFWSDPAPVDVIDR